MRLPQVRQDVRRCWGLPEAWWAPAVSSGSGWQGSLPALPSPTCQPHLPASPWLRRSRLGREILGAFKAAGWEAAILRRFWAHLPVQSGGGRPAKRGNSVHLNGRSQDACVPGGPPVKNGTRLHTAAAEACVQSGDQHGQKETETGRGDEGPLREASCGPSPQRGSAAHHWLRSRSHHDSAAVARRASGSVVLARPWGGVLGRSLGGWRAGCPPGAGGEPRPMGGSGRWPFAVSSFSAFPAFVSPPLPFPRSAPWLTEDLSVCLPTGHGPEDGTQTPRLSCSS